MQKTTKQFERMEWKGDYAHVYKCAGLVMGFTEGEFPLRGLAEMLDRPPIKELKQIHSAIIKKADDFQAADVDQQLFQHESEPALLAAYEAVKKKVEDNLKKDLFDQALVEIASLRDTVDAFFEGVMVMADDMAVRRNRLALLGLIATLFGGFADF
ncbi:MAG: hypothetical protein GY765_30775, partial [bacterium]|nr:hypothetical protein [bacterium]